MFYSDPVLFRTRSVILTNRHLVINGTEYPLSDITAVCVERATYFGALQVGRLAAVLFAGLLLVAFINKLDAAKNPVLTGMTLLGVLATAAAAYVLFMDVPVHSVAIIVGDEHIPVLNADAERSAFVAGKIDRALHNGAVEPS